ncbi:MAG: single-stranded DNA-binding protein [Caldilineales bacterium]|nr:single-stranded DNA-binding protein [Caldilineales bacterium]
MYQKTIVIGHLGRDPEMRYTPSGQAVTSFSVATSRRWTGQDGQQQEKTTWFRVSAWGKLAEICNQYLNKGSLVLVEGDVDASAFTGQDGQPRASLELNARNVQFMPRGSQSASYDDDNTLRDRGGLEEEEIPF